jgi:hypothetical protein
MPTTSAGRLTSFIQPLQWVGAVELGAVLGWEGHVGQHVVLAVVHQDGELWRSRSQLVGNVPLAQQLRRGVMGARGHRRDRVDKADACHIGRSLGHRRQLQRIVASALGC